MGLGGLAVTIDGRAGTLPGSLDLTAYRIVQEGLANVARHSAAATALVGFCSANGTLEITVADDGPPRPGPAAAPGGPGGHGLIGLRERVARYGGELMAGPRLGGGFLLRATLPVRDLADDWPHESTAALAPAEPQPAGQPDLGPPRASQCDAARPAAAPPCDGGTLTAAPS